MLCLHQRSLIFFLFFFYFLFGHVIQGAFASSLGDSLADNFANRRLNSFVPKEPMPNCSRSPPCSERKIFNKYEMTTLYSMSNAEQRILMEFSPKASCTTAAMMFMKSMGFQYGTHYVGWPHDFRFGYFYSNCGRITPCMYSNSSWIRFKVVRNPYDRVVSSYFHCMKMNILDQHIFFGNESMYSSFTFENFVDFLSTLTNRTAYEKLAAGHFKLQSTEFEYNYFRSHNRKSLFHVIVKVEDPHESIQLLNRLIHERAIRSRNQFKNVTFVLEDLPHTVNHYVPRTNETHDYVGNLSWAEIKHRIPSTYRYFFREPYINKVKRIYADDLYLYNYIFPYRD